jgi:crotonobetainyl-CoA:carnitine CoA-transferase CaiB-like acyl-CoA transferase
VTYPGPPYRHREAPWQIRRRPPLLGEHTAEILQGELGLTPDQITALTGAGVI